MDTGVFGNEAFRDRTKMTELVVRNVKRFFEGRAAPVDLESWACEAVAELWSDDVRVTAFIPALALRDVGERVVETEGGVSVSKRRIAA